jgi:hypothetical protein
MGLWPSYQKKGKELGVDGCSGEARIFLKLEQNVSFK